MIWIGEGSHNLLSRKSQGGIIETHAIMPSMTTIRGMNPSVISQRFWGRCDCDFRMENENCEGGGPFRESNNGGDEI
jgi:hypothetical protein